MTWSDSPHRCSVPFDEVPQEKGWVKYWTCSCGDEFRVTCGEYGAKSLTADGEFISWGVSAQKLTRRNY